MSGTNGAGGIAPNSIGNEPASMGVNNSGCTTALMDLLLNANIQPGEELDYQTAKTIYTHHPLGAKIVDSPIRMAQSQAREITVGSGPDTLLIEAFLTEQAALGTDEVVAATVSIARTYGASTLVCGEVGKQSGTPLDLDSIAGRKIYFSSLDPLNTSGSLVLCQDPNSPDFQKPNDVSVQGQVYHRSRVVVVMNERPVYLSFTNSALGFSGRSVYQRALYPLKSFIQTLITDDMVSRKAGLLIAKVKQPGSIVNNMMQVLSAAKRVLLQIGQTDNVLTVGHEDAIESLNLMNIDGAGTFARNNIIKNIATAVPMPARWITEDSLAQGFGEGKEDRATEAVYVDKMRAEMQPLYDFMDRIVMRRAWDEAFYATVQAQFPAYENIKYATAFAEWENSFKATWPSFLQETESEQSKTEKVRFDAMVQLMTLLLPACDPVNKASLIQWMQDNTNSQELLFPVPLMLDAEAMAEYTPPTPEGEEGGEGDAKADSYPRAVA